MPGRRLRQEKRVKDLPLPKPEGMARLIRRGWRSRKQLSAFRYWIYFVGLPTVAACLILYVFNGFVNGWTTSYEVLLAITSPWDDLRIKAPILAMPLSIAGWIIMPSFVGAISGYAVVRAIDAHRESTAEEIAKAFHLPATLGVEQGEGSPDA